MDLQTIQQRIYEIRDQKVMLDFDLAELYEVETRVLKQNVRRNINRFPDDFMFQLNKKEWIEVITICDNLPQNIKFSPITPFAFTEQGVAMLSSVLNSPKAIEINIQIIRAFVFLRQYALTHKDLTRKLEELESKFDQQFDDVYEALDYLVEKDSLESQQKDRKQIGFKEPEE
ncbi:ORF6N domain-containing protein [bacterium]|nr:ORF6N domain-containing protein [bacterium]